MKIYIIQEEDYEGINIYGIFSSKEKAIEYFPFLEGHYNEKDIKEYQIDPEKPLIKYQDNFGHYISKNNKEWSFTGRILETKFVPFILNKDAPEDHALYLGFGKTAEEAKENAYKCKKENS